MSRANSAGTRRVVSSRGSSATARSQPNMMTVLSGGNEGGMPQVSHAPPRPSSSRPSTTGTGRSRTTRQSVPEGGLTQLSGPPMAERQPEAQSAEDRALARAMDKIQRLDVKLHEILARERDVKRRGRTDGDDNDGEASEDDGSDGDDGGVGFFTTQPPESVGGSGSENEDHDGNDTGDAPKQKGKRKGKRGGAEGKGASGDKLKQKQQDKIQRNIKLAADGKAGVLAMTPEEKERLNELLADIDSIDESVSELEETSVRQAPNPYRLDEAVQQLADIDRRLEVMTRGRQSIASSVRTSNVPSELGSLFAGHSKVKEALRNEDDEARASLAAIDSEIERLRHLPAEGEAVDERMLEMLMMEAQAEQAYYDQVDAHAQQLDNYSNAGPTADNHDDEDDGNAPAQ
ncbi:hypothetical protein PTSG_08169 [Salpingoeca rosetta]|uniref:Fibrous sheath-interacting protein 1 n=1 Tax=Salpingoeca rosetta (strain ATCC 50818 / BSB-021) TaxID=946362 RepID=F2UI72_SALR5|nr:uncharacterized protein PTSG_08169 [Salpingoeca rosetta]EGD76821.1 hypothetical protein PTSG_08169 [Salpingoeca rosetta]|eukprot:XP_004991193.1 hypothetical protein PTSG_08169 [Salpingoeca rosetta]